MNLQIFGVASRLLGLHVWDRLYYLGDFALDIHLFSVPLLEPVPFKCTIEVEDQLHVCGVTGLHHIVQEVYHAIPLTPTRPVRVVAPIQPVQATLSINHQVQAGRANVATPGSMDISLFKLLLGEVTRNFQQVNRLTCLRTFFLNKLLQMFDTHGDS